MWCFTLLLLVGAVVAQSEHEHGWEMGKQYQYLVRSRTLSTLDQLNGQSSSGIMIKAVLTIQAASTDKLQATITQPQFARIHTLSEGLDAEISDQELTYHELPVSKKPFEIVVKHGMIRDLLVEKNMPTWELNLLKGIVSQLQVDTQGENALHDHSTQEPKDGLYASYKTMEDTVGGKCEVLYDISPLSANDRYNLPELAPLLTGNEDNQLINIRKTKNYNNCKQQRGYHFGLTGRLSLTQGSDYKDKLTTKSTDSRIVISGDLKQFTIQSSVTMNHIFVKSERPVNSFIGTVYSKLNITLVKMDKISTELSHSENLVSTGNLLYTYNNPLTEIEQGKRHQETISRNSQQIQSAESSSSEQNQGKNWQKQRDGSSSSSSSSSSAVSSSEELNHLQTLPSLNEAPKSMTPLSLAFQDKEKSMDTVQVAQKQAREIINDLQQSNNVLTQDTLEKFTNFVNVLRLMNNQQIAEVEQSVVENKNVLYDFESDGNSFVKNDAWNVIRDGVAQAGTGPALLTIITWMQNGKLNGVEAARVISKIPKVVRIPSEDYVEAVFEKLVVDHKVQQQEFVNKIVPIAFSELVRKAQVDKRHSQDAYPIYNFGKLNPKNDKTITEKYIPYMEKQLQKYLKNNDNAQAQAYIVALGNFGHPKALTVFEPFLEGQQEASTYLRTLMVSSMRSLVRRYPGLVASVLYKIYLNEQESHEVRCAAVHLYMLTDPPLVSMLRMAKYTNIDKSNEVSAAVKSSIISISKWNRPQYYLLIQKARYARRLLTPKRFSSTDSQGIFKDTVIMQTIGSVDSYVPKNVYINSITTFGNIAKSIFEMEYGVSSAKQLMDIFEKPEAHEESAWLDNIRQSLGMQEKTAEQMEGHFRISNIFGTTFYPFDQQSIEKFASHIKKNLKKVEGTHINRLDSYEETVSFPTENGLPFTYSIEVPTLTRAFFKNPADHQTDKKVSGIANVIFANKVQTRFGVVLSHEHEHYIAGVDRNSYVHVPIEYNVNMESKQPFYNVEVQVRVDPTEQSSPLKLLHRSVVPFTTRLNMLELLPASRTNVLRVLDTKNMKKSTVRVGTIQLVSEKDQQTDLNSESVMEMFKSFYDDSINYKKVEIHNFFEKDNDARHDKTTVSVAYDELQIQDNNNEEHEPSIHDTVLDITEKQPNSATRRKQLLQEVSKGLKSVKASVYDVAVDIPFLENRQVLTISVGHSNVERKTQYLVYWNRLSKTGEVLHEALITGTVKSTQNDFLRYNKAIQSVPQNEFTIIMRVGKNYRQAEKVLLQGKLLQDESLQETLMKSKTVRQCLHEIKLGKGLKVCQKAIGLALKKNLLQMSIKFDSDVHSEIADIILNHLGEILPNADIDLTKLENSENLKNKINVQVKMSPNYENMETAIRTSQMNLKFQLHDSAEGQLRQQDENEGFEDEEQKASCILNGKELVTFDGKDYPLQLGGVWHVLLIPDQQTVSTNMKLAVLAREVNNHIQVRTLLGTKKEYLLQQSDNHLQALVDGEEVDVTEDRSYPDREGGKLLAEIFVQPDGSLKLNLENFGINILYDGQRVQLEVTKNYRNEILGLCGNYDNQVNNDFLTPQNCILQKPEEFSATFALLDNENKHSNSYRTIVTNKEKANHAACTPLIPRQTNVINDKEAGRFVLGKQLWGYHQSRNQNRNQKTVQFIYRTRIDEDDQEICFSVRPLPVCPENSNPTEMKKKIVAMHCMPKSTEAAHDMKRRVQNGANPDLAHKSINKKRTYEIPTTCQTY